METLKKIVRKIARFFKMAFMIIMGEDPCKGHLVHKPKHKATIKTKVKRYQRGQNVEPIYKADAIEKGNEVVGHIYTLSCPMCGRAVKRSEEYCGECGNHMEHKMEVSQIC